MSLVIKLDDATDSDWIGIMLQILLFILSGRYNSLAEERLLAQETCCDVPSLAPPRVFDENRFSRESGRQHKILKVGYVSYDWRNHPMGW